MPARPRHTIRRLMALVLLIAAVLGLAIPAVEVYRAKEYHVHTGVDTRTTPHLASWGGIEPPFWPRYLKRLAGRPWRRQPCSFRTGFEADRCEFAYPGMALRIGNRVGYGFASEQSRKVDEILKRKSP